MKAVQVKSEITQCKTIEISELLNKFIRYVDVSPSSVRAYVFGVKAFIRYLSENGISAPTRNTILEYKKHYPRQKAQVRYHYIFQVYAVFLHGAQVRIYTVILLPA